MPIYASSPEFDALMEEFKAASDAEGSAIRNLHDLMKLSADMETLKQATKTMEDTHNRKMDLFNQMQAHRLDKG